MREPILTVQEIPLEHPDSNNMFMPSPEKPFVATPGAIEAYSYEVIMACLRTLQQTAKRYDGIDYIQTFRSPEPGKPDLWIVEDGEGGAITALLPSEY